MSSPSVKVKLTQRWGEYGPGREMDLPDWLAADLLKHGVCRKSDPELIPAATPARETAEAPRGEQAAVTGKPAPARTRTRGAAISAALKPEAP
ncbi:MAG TPA: hypothetical protein VM223_07580 [Planctomycetota bacterium]|nr:hypothetical protein [Planctomycetota bacterium]